MSTVPHDLRYAIRMLRKTPLFTCVAVLTLALGIGLNSAVFSAVDALLLRPMPGVRKATEIVQLFRTYPGELYGSNSVPHFVDVRDRSRDIFSGTAAWGIEPVNLSSGGRTATLTGEMVSANFFDVLGVIPERGRGFVAAEDSSPGAHPVAVVSHAAWQGLFGGTSDIVGKAVTLDGHRYTIVGVAPPDFRGPIPLVAPSIWVPLMRMAQIRPGTRDGLTTRGNNFMNVVARLRPGVSPQQARDRLNAVSARLQEIYPDDYKGAGIALYTLSEGGSIPSFRSAEVGLSSVVMAVVALLLLIACVNVANLFLARARDRWREMAVRLSIGASRSQLIRQLLTEALVFSLLAGTVGLLVAWWAIGLVNHIRLPINVALEPDLRLSAPVLLFTFGITLATGVLFGLVPALQATRPSLVPALKGESSVGGGRSRMSRGLVIAQTALSIVLLVCAGLFLRSLGAASSMDTGFSSDDQIMATVDLELQGYDRPRAAEFFRRLTERLRALPTVRAVGLGRSIPLGLGGSDEGVTIPGYTPAPNESMSINYNIASPGYFDAMGMRITRGRGFTERDDSAAARVVVVNQRFVDRFWPGEDGLGRRFHTGGGDYTVVGVLPTGKYRSLGEPPTAFMYFAQAQQWSGAMYVHIRSTGDPVALAPALRNEVAALDPDLPMSDIRTMRNHLGIALLPARLVGAVLGIFGMLGLILAAVGIYGVMAYSVAQRTREIGIRMAVGAASGQVVGLIVRQGLTLVAIGTAVGLAGAVGGARLVRSLLYGASALDPVTFVAVPSVLAAVALVAILVPARRAARVDPMRALRSE